MLRERALGVVAASLAVALLGCPPQDNGTGRRTGDDDVLTAGQVVGIARAINTGEIDVATAVRGKLPQGAAGGMVDMIIKDHQKSLQDLERVSVQLSLVPEESDISRELQEDVEKTRSGFAESGEDVAGLEDDFIQSQVDMHEKALEVIDDDLLPATTEPTLTEYLGKLRASVYHHLESAKALQGGDVREHRGTMDPRDTQEDLEKEREANEDRYEEEKDRNDERIDQRQERDEELREEQKDRDEDRRGSGQLEGTRGTGDRGVGGDTPPSGTTPR